MTPRSAEEVQRAARGFRLELNRGKDRFWDVPPKDEIDRIDPRRIVKGLLRVNLSDAEEYELEEPGTTLGNLPVRVGAVLDRSRNSIQLATRFSEEIRRYTLARAIGLWVLYPEFDRLILSPSLAGYRGGRDRPQQERDADGFADELLMPANLVRAYFRRLFTVDTLWGLPISEALSKLSWRGMRLQLTGADMITKGRENLSLMAAVAVPEDQALPAIAPRFGVSPLAMSMRLEYLRQV